MKPERHLAELRSHGERLSDLLAAGPLDIDVPTCPQWQVADLLAHVGMVHRWATLNLTAGPDPETGGPQVERETEPVGDPVSWYRDGHAQLLRTLTDAPPDVVAVRFLANAGTPREFWARRQAHETAIHCVDVAAARGTTIDLAPDFAEDGIAELLEGFYGRRGGRLRSPTPRTLAVQVKGGPRWTMQIGPDGRDVQRDSTASAQATVRGGAADLYLFLWNRLGVEAVEVDGDHSVVELWREKARVSWS